MSHAVLVRMDDELYEELSREAAADVRSRAAVMRRALREYLDRVARP